MLSATAKDDKTGTEVNNLLWYTVGVPAGSSAGIGTDTVTQGLKPPPVQLDPTYNMLLFLWETSAPYDQTYNAVQMQATDIFGNTLTSTASPTVVVANSLPSLAITALSPAVDSATVAAGSGNQAVQPYHLYYQAVKYSSPAA